MPWGWLITFMSEQIQASFIWNLANSFLAFLDKRSESKMWPMFVFAIAVLISIFCWVPYYPAISEFIQSPYGQGKTWWLEHPFQSVPVEQFFPLSERHIGYNSGIASHLDKMTYRAFLPLLNQVAPYGIWTLVVACHVGLIAIFWFSYQVVLQQVGDKVIAALASWAVATCYAGQYGFHDIYYGDAAAVGMLIAAMFSKKRISIFILIIFAGFTDERAITSAPLVLLFHFLREQDFKQARTLFAFALEILKTGAPVIGGILFYVIIRLSLTFLTGERSGSSMLASIDILRAHIYNDYPQLIFKVFEFLWILPFVFLVEFGLKKPSKKLVVALFGLAIALAAFPAMVVWDIDRSLFYLLPGIILAICFMPFSLKGMRVMLLAVLAGNVLWIYPSSSGFRKIDHFISSFVVLEKK
jgi:hypothetical protein